MICLASSFPGKLSKEKQNNVSPGNFSHIVFRLFAVPKSFAKKQIEKFNLFAKGSRV
jgi:hypothetical protein